MAATAQKSACVLVSAAERFYSFINAFDHIDNEADVDQISDALSASLAKLDSHQPRQCRWRPNRARHRPGRSRNQRK
jgi:hypothetical protein